MANTSSSLVVLAEVNSIANGNGDNSSSIELVSLLKKTKKLTGQQVGSSSSSSSNKGKGLRGVAGRERQHHQKQSAKNKSSLNLHEAFPNAASATTNTDQRLISIGIDETHQVLATTTAPKQQQTIKKPQKPRRRVATLAQRRAANIRERRRMFNLNAAFDRLRKKVPSFAYEKRLSRIETLKLAIMYIKFMDDLVNDDAYAEKYKQLTANTNSHHQTHQSTSGFLSSGTYLSLYGQCESPLSSPPAPHLLSALPAIGSRPPHRGQQQRVSSSVEQETPLQSTTSTSADALLSQQQQQLGGRACPPASSSSSSSPSSSSSSSSSSLLEGGGGVSSSIVKTEDINNNSSNNCRASQQLGHFRCAPSELQHQQTFQTRQYRARAHQSSESPISSSSLACCLSPATSSSTVNSICHSATSSTTFANESPNSPSPMTGINLHQPSVSSGAPGVVNGTHEHPANNLYYPQGHHHHQEQQQHQHYAPTYDQQGPISPYYGPHANSSTCESSKILYYNEINGGELHKPPMSSVVQNCYGQVSTTLSHHLGHHQQHHLSGHHQQYHHNQEHHHQHHRQQQHQDQHQVSSYSLQSLEAR